MKVPPHNTDAERSVLGSLLIDGKAILKIVDLVDDQDFYDERHAIIYRTVLDLYKKHIPIDLLTLSSSLSEQDKLEIVGGDSYIAELVSNVPTASHVVQYAKIVHQKSTLRKLIKAGSDIEALGFDENSDLLETLEQAEKSIFSVSQNFLKENFTPIKKVLDKAFEKIAEMHNNKDKSRVQGVPSGFRDLDQMLSGFNPSDLVIIAARPAMGKTSFILNLAQNIACDAKTPVGVFSLEMSKEQLVERMFCNLMRVDSWKLRTGRLTDEDFARIGGVMDKLAEAPIFIDDSPGCNIVEIRAKARRLQYEHNVGIIFIDYLQLMSGNSRNQHNRVQEISEISRSLKSLARELNVPIIALSQLSRAVESRPDKRPQLSDLRESGSIEQDADIVMMMYRDDYYNPETDDKGIVELLIRKHRNGPTGTVQLYFNREQMRYITLETKREVQAA